MQTRNGSMPYQAVVLPPNLDDSYRQNGLSGKDKEIEHISFYRSPILTERLYHAACIHTYTYIWVFPRSSFEQAS
jgi:hypothetical protein